MYPIYFKLYFLVPLDTGHLRLNYLKERILYSDAGKKKDAQSSFHPLLQLKQEKVIHMELSNEFIEDLFFRQMKELTLKTNKQLRSFDAQFSGIRLKR